MENLNVEKIFTEEDKKFNRMMIDCALESRQKRELPDRRGGKMQMGNHLESMLLEHRDYDFSSEILADFRRKWGIFD